MIGSSQGMGNKIPKGYDLGRIQNFTPEMMELFQRMISQLGPDNFLSKLLGGDESAFEEMEAPAMRQFAGLQGNLASRFSGQGTGGRHSSGFQNTMNQASSDFAQDLQSRRHEIKSQALKDLQSMGNTLLQQKPYEQFLTEKPQKKPSFLQQMLGALLPGLGAGLGGIFGGPSGASIGGRAGSAAGQGFRF